SDFGGWVVDDRNRPTTFPSFPFPRAQAPPSSFDGTLFSRGEVEGEEAGPARSRRAGRADAAGRATAPSRLAGPLPRGPHTRPAPPPPPPPVPPARPPPPPPRPPRPPPPTTPCPSGRPNSASQLCSGRCRAR